MESAFSGQSSCPPHFNVASTGVHCEVFTAVVTYLFAALGKLTAKLHKGPQ